MINYVLPQIFTKVFFLKILNKLLRKSVDIKFEKANYNRVSFVQRAIANKNIKTCKYLEIGCSTNTLFNSIPLKMSNKVGVDPDKGGTHKMTSDNFFKENNQKFDVIFIDGLHTYEQCQRDVINSLNSLNNDGLILLHDMMPTNNFEATSPRNILAVNSWNGDVWKVAVELSASKNLDFILVSIDKGVGIIRKKENFEYKILKEIKNKSIFDYYSKYFKNINLKKSEEAIDFIDL